MSVDKKIGYILSDKNCVGYSCVRIDFTVMVNDIERFTTQVKNILK